MKIHDALETTFSLFRKINAYLELHQLCFSFFLSWVEKQKCDFNLAVDLFHACKMTRPSRSDQSGTGLAATGARRRRPHLSF